MKMIDSLAERHARAQLSIVRSKAELADVNNKINNHAGLVVPKQKKVSALREVGEFTAFAVVVVGTACLADMGYRAILKKTGLENIK